MSKSNVIDLDDWVQNPRLKVLKYDKKTTKYFYRQSDRAGFDITDNQYLLYLNKRLLDFRYRIYSEKHPWSIDAAVRATLYTPSAGVYRFNMWSVNFTSDTLCELYKIYKTQAAQRVGDRAIAGDVILLAYDIASRNPICNSFPGARDYVAGGTGECVWLDTFCKKQSGVEYDYKKHLFTPAEYEIVSQMLHRKFMADERALKR